MTKKHATIRLWQNASNRATPTGWHAELQFPNGNYHPLAGWGTDLTQDEALAAGIWKAQEHGFDTFSISCPAEWEEEEEASDAEKEMVSLYDELSGELCVFERSIVYMGKRVNKLAEVMHEHGSSIGNFKGKIRNLEQRVWDAERRLNALDGQEVDGV